MGRKLAVVAVGCAATIGTLGIAAAPAGAATPTVTKTGVATATSGAVDNPEILVGVIAILEQVAINNPDMRPGFGSSTITSR